MESRPICPNCRAFISRADRVCPYCDFALTPQAAAPILNSRTLSELMPGEGQMTQILLGANFLFYCATILYDQQNTANPSLFEPNGITLAIFGSKYTPLIYHGEWWRLLTAGFLHASLMHILFNSWGLFQLGAEVDDALGSARYLCAYVFSTMTGFLASTIFSPQAPSVGASAGIFGLLGALIAYATVQGGLMGRYMRSAYINSAIIAILLTAFSGHTDNWAHIGGLAGGFVFVYTIGKLNLTRPSLNRTWNIAGLGAFGFVLLCFGLQFYAALRLLQ